MVLSLFPGIGLLDLAFEMEDYCVVRGPDVLWGGDIRRFHPPAGVFAGIIGGPPCQTFSSLAHLVRANGHEPRFGNLIPEFERCVLEAQPAWFLMENVPQAPEPVVSGYGVKSFLLDNSALDSGDGFGHEQRRLRRFSFGVRMHCGCAKCVPAGGQHHNGPCRVPDLRRWIDLATFLLPDADSTVSRSTFDNTEDHHKIRRQAVLSDPSAVPVKIGGKGRYRLADALRLQGLPPDFLKDAPFTKEGKLKAVANGVPIFMGRALAKAVKSAIIA